MTVLFWFRKNTRALERPGTINCRVTVDKVEHNFATCVRVHKTEWNSTSQEVRGRSDAARVANQQLQQVADGLREAFNILEREGVYITPTAVVKRYHQPQARKQSLLAIFGQYIEQREALVAVGQLSPASVEADRVRLNLLEKWLTEQGLAEMRPQELRAARVEQFVQWLRAQKRKKNYAMKVAQTFKSVLKWCVKQELLDTNPMEGFEFRFDAPEALVFLTPIELVRLWFYKFDNQALRKVADLFLFQCFTGLAWRDLYNFRASEDLVPRPDGAILLLINRQKTSTTAAIPLLRPAAEVLAKYGGERLPVPSNQYYNRMLKQVAYMIGLQKHITTHVGRKTAGMILLQDGVSMTIVSRVLGHKSVSITEKYYAHVLADTVTNEMSKVLGHQTVGVTRTMQPFLTEFAGYLASGTDSSEGWDALRA
jgi:site-specific recombinase XerD